MKTTPLTSRHEALGAKMVAFAGYNMPVYYSGIKEEHHAVRNDAGIFDVSHMGEFMVTGKDAQAFLQHLATNDITQLYPGRAQYNCMTNEKGGIIDDLIIYQLDDNRYMAVVNAANIEKDWDWFQQNAKGFDVDLENASDKTALIAVQGPKALDILKGLTNIDLEELKFYTFTKGKVADAEDVIISATGYTGEKGFEFYCNSDVGAAIWDAVMKSGQDHGIKAAGLGARDTLRLEAGLNLYGNDMDETTTPLEARLGWITKLDTDFIGKDFLAQQKEEGVSRKLVGFELLEKGIPRHGNEIVDENGDSIGYVTSGTQSPTLDKAIGMGYVKKGYTKVGTDINIQVRNKTKAAKVVKLPFYKSQ